MQNNWCPNELMSIYKNPNFVTWYNFFCDINLQQWIEDKRDKHVIFKD